MEEAFVADKAKPAPRHQRGEPRESMLLKALMRVDDETAVRQLRVRNLSAGGMMADCTAVLAKGQPVEIELRNIGAVPGHIAWADGARIGVAFVDPIDPQLARKPVGTGATEAMLVRAPSMKVRRPGLKIGS